MGTRTYVLLVTLIFLGSPSLGFTAEESAPSPADQVQSSITKARDVFRDLYDRKQISFAEDAEAKYLRALVELGHVSDYLRVLNEDEAGDAKLDEFLAEARVVRQLMESLIMRTRNLNEYVINEGMITVDIEASAVYDRLRRRIPNLDKLIEGSVKIDPGKARLALFNELKGEFSGLIMEAAAIDNQDMRVVAMAKWAARTKICVSREFGAGCDQIMSYRTLMELDID